jgi:hypothetical protein
MPDQCFAGTGCWGRDGESMFTPEELVVGFPSTQAAYITIL